MEAIAKCQISVAGQRCCSVWSQNENEVSRRDFADLLREWVDHLQVSFPGTIGTKTLLLYLPYLPDSEREWRTVLRRSSNKYFCLV